MRYQELRPGDIIEWLSEDKLEGPGKITSFLTIGTDPVGAVVLDNGRNITKDKVVYKIIQEKKIEIIKT